MSGETKTQITPSPAARALFGQMVNRADRNLHLALAETLELAVERVKAGHRDTDELNQLVREEWIDRAPDGGWLLH